MFSMNWSIGIAIMSAIILLAGFITSRNLPEPAKKVRIQKFAATAMILMLISYPIFQPFVSGFSETKFLSELKFENPGSIDEIAKLDKDQTHNIEVLKSEVEDLRKDVYLLNRYYGNITLLLSFGLIALYINCFFRKEKNAE
jgi:hypothetical protein